MGNDLNNFYNAIQNGLSPKSLNLGGILVAIGLLQSISVFFLLIVINRYLREDTKSEKFETEVARN
jgi:hypothetical protein